MERLQTLASQSLCKLGNLVHRLIRLKAPWAFGNSSHTSNADDNRGHTTALIDLFIFEGSERRLTGRSGGKLIYKDHLGRGSNNWRKHSKDSEASAVSSKLLLGEPIQPYESDIKRKPSSV